jgi:hypothetical protein
MTRHVESVEVLRFHDSTGGLQKFYQVFVVSQHNYAIGRDDYFIVANWGAGAEAPIKQDCKGQVSRISVASTYQQATTIAQRRVQEKLAKGYTLYTQYGSAAKIAVPGKVASELPPEPAHTVPESEKAAPLAVIDHLRDAASKFTSEAARIRPLLRGRPEHVAEAWMLRADLEADLEEMRRVVIQSEATLELVGMQLMQTVTTPVDSGRSSK